MAYLDQKGDANGSNGQGEQGVDLGVPTEPASVPEADILRIALTPIPDGGKSTGFAVTFSLAGTASNDFTYELWGRFNDLRCDFVVRYAPPVTEVRNSCRRDTVRLPDAFLQPQQLTIVVPFDRLPKGIEPGHVLDRFDAFTIKRTGPLYVPKLDVASTEKSWVIPGGP